jgi:hypothetical protein
MKDNLVIIITNHLDTPPTLGTPGTLGTLVTLVTLGTPLLIYPPNYDKFAP